MCVNTHGSCSCGVLLTVLLRNNGPESKTVSGTPSLLYLLPRVSFSSQPWAVVDTSAHCGQLSSACWVWVWVQPNAWPARPGHFSHSLLVVHNEEWTGLYWRVGQPLFDTRVRGASIWKLWKKEKGKRQRQKCSLQGFHAFMWEEEMRWFKAAQIKKGPQEAVQDYFTRQSDQIEFFCWVQCVE